MFNEVVIRRGEDPSNRLRIRNYTDLSRHVMAAHTFLLLANHLPTYAEEHNSTPRMTKEKVRWLGREAGQFGHAVIDLIPDDMGIDKEWLMQDAQYAQGSRIKSSYEGTVVHTCAMAANANQYFFSASRKDFSAVRRKIAEDTGTRYTEMLFQNDPLKDSTQALVDTLTDHYVIPHSDLRVAQSTLAVRAVRALLFHSWEDVFSIPL